MFSLLIKDRGIPISVYMSYMMRVKGLTRTESVMLLTHSAVKMGIREVTTPPANNTVGDWGRRIDTPLWAIVSAMKLLEQCGKIPFTQQEWAFWAYAEGELKSKGAAYKGKWLEWLSRAERFKASQAQRSEIRKELQSLSFPHVAMKIMLLFSGNEVKEMSHPEIFANLDSSMTTIRLLNTCIIDGRRFSYDELNDAIESDKSHRINEEIIVSIQELKMISKVNYHSSGNITIA